MGKDGDTFGSRLRELRVDRDIGLREFAERVGLSATYISKIERDELVPPTAERIVEFARVLRTDADELFALSKRMPKDVENILDERPREMLILMRKAGKLSDEDLNKLIHRLGKGENEK